MRQMLKCVTLAGTAIVVVTSPIGPGRAQILQAAHAREEPRVRVLQRELLGRYIDDLDFVPNGPFANHIVMVNGYEVHGVPVNAESPRAIRRLFDFRQQVATASGITYIASEGLFAVVDVFEPTRLILFDHHGTPLPPRPIEFLNGFVPDLAEGLAYTGWVHEGGSVDLRGRGRPSLAAVVETISAFF